MNDAAETIGAAPPLLLDAEAEVDFELLEDDEPHPAINAAATKAGTKARFQTAIEVLPSLRGRSYRALLFLDNSCVSLQRGNLSHAAPHVHPD